MARVAGKAGRYASSQVSEKWARGTVVLYIAGVLVSFVYGLSLAKWALWKGITAIAIQLGILLVVCAFVRKMDKEAASWWKGYKGEVLVAKKLIDELPNTFWVINDIQTPLGNFDHVVVGPTGVFAVETKNWRGWVTPDGKGELLVNGKPVGNHVRTLYNRIMGVKGRLTKTDRYIQGVMVFASAYEDAPWGTTQSINCISIDSIPDYFTKMQRPSKPLSPNEVDAIAQAFQEIGRLDKDFTVRTKVS